MYAICTYNLHFTYYTNNVKITNTKLNFNQNRLLAIIA